LMAVIIVSGLLNIPAVLGLVFETWWSCSSGLAL